MAYFHIIYRKLNGNGGAFYFGQGEAEGGTYIRSAFNKELLPVGFHNMFYNSQAEAGSSLLPRTRFIHAEKALGDPVNILLLNADAGILDINQNTVFVF